MKRLVIAFSIFVVLLASCTPNEEERFQEIDKLPIEESSEEVKAAIQTMTVESAEFSFIAGWLTNREIVFVEKVEGDFHVKVFDILTGDTRPLYTESSLVVDVFIHPSEQLLLVHTAPDSTAAILKIVSTEGKVLDEITVASTEIAIEWNDMDSTRVLITAFYADWTFDVFLYDGQEEQLVLSTIQDPFPRWFGKEKIVYQQLADHSLDGGELFIYDVVTTDEEPMGMTEVVHFDTAHDQLLTVQIEDEHSAFYKVIGEDGQGGFSWKMPVVSNYSEWVFPEMVWLSTTALLIPSPEKGGQLDRLQQSFKLFRVTDGEQEVVFDEGFVTGNLVCSPDGGKCLTGYALENLIDIEKGDETLWLVIQE